MGGSNSVPPNPIPPDQGTEQEFVIPAPSVDISESDFYAAAREIEAYDAEDLETQERRQQAREWSQKHWLKWALFVIVIGMNFWWDRNVLWMLETSGAAKSGFHLGDSVLITLASTSIANFLALVIVIAKHLFPERNRTSKRRRR